MASKGPVYLRYHKSTCFAGNSTKSENVPLNNWQTPIVFKSYPRFPKVTLPESSDAGSRPLLKAIFQRRSERMFSTESAVEMPELSRILAGLQITSDEGLLNYHSQRAYASAGACYPLEAYILPIRVSGLQQHVYHYHVRTHALEQLWAFRMADFEACFSRESWCVDAGAIIVLTGCHTRTYEKYLEKAYQFCLLEAGQAAQNIHLLATGEGLASCSFGGFYEEPLMRLLDLNPNEEIVLTSVVIGKRDDNAVVSNLGKPINF